jgi:hypothetical protein
VINGPVSIGDGAFDSDKNSMLSDLNLHDKDLGPVLGSILARDHIGLDLSGALMARPMKKFRHGLWNEFREGEIRRDFARQIYSLACLQRTGEDIKPRLATMSSSRLLKEEQRKFVRTLQEIMEQRQLEFGDVETLEYEDSLNNRAVPGPKPDQQQFLRIGPLAKRSAAVDDGR